MTALGILYGSGAAVPDDPAHLDDVPVVLDVQLLRFSQQIALLLRAGRVEEAWHLADTLGVDLESDPSAKAQGALIPFIRVYIARGLNLAALSPLLKRAVGQCNRIGDRYSELWLLALHAWQQLKLNRRRAAAATLERAIQLAHETGYIRIILDIPELRALLEQADDVEPHLRSGPGDGGPDRAEIVLTPKECTVLSLLAEDYRYERIAQELRISVNTVQTHVRNLYTKLGVNRRAQAITRAREMKLL